MSTTYSDIEDCISRLAGPDMTYQTSLSASALRGAISTVIEREVSAAIAAAVLQEREALTSALLPFAHPDLCKTLAGNVQGDESIIFQRNDAVLTIGDFKRAAAAIRARGNGGK